MSGNIKLGFLSANSSDIYDLIPVVRENINEDVDFNMERAGNGDLQATQQSNKALITVDTDYLSQTQLGNVRKVLANRAEPHKLYTKFPATYTDYTFDATTNECFTAEDDDGTQTTFSTEFTSGEYTNINTFDTNAVTFSTSDKGSSNYYKYGYMQFTADISDYINEHDAESITRITLALRNLYINDGADAGFKIDYLDNSYSPARYVEIKRMGITIDENNTVYASIRPISQFTNFSNALDSNVVKFRVRNLYENRDTTSAVTLSVDFAKVFVNGYGCVWDGNDNFTYRDTYVGNGYTGQIRLMEL